MTFEGFVSVLGAELAVDPVGWCPQSRFVEDLGFDSLGLFELYLVLEGLAGREFSDDLLDAIVTVEDAWAWAGAGVGSWW